MNFTNQQRVFEIPHFAERGSRPFESPRWLHRVAVDERGWVASEGLAAMKKGVSMKKVNLTAIKGFSKGRCPLVGSKGLALGRGEGDRGPLQKENKVIERNK